MSNTNRMLKISLLTALSLSLFLLETLIPLPFLPPGAKLGFANLITVTALYLMPSAKDVFLILILRILLSSLFYGGPLILAYSLAGGLLSLIGMILLKKHSTFSILSVSAAGGFLHNLGQLTTAALLMESPLLRNYLPILGPCGILTGLLIGMVSTLTLKRLHLHR